MPVRFSRETPLSLSVSFCILLNLGITTTMMEMMQTRRSTTATTVAQVSCILVARIFRIAHTAVMGAATAILSSMIFATCTC